MLTIISGGQTGVDRAALDVAIKWKIPYGGWCPAGRWAEDGTIPDQYLLCDTPGENPKQRTIWNVCDSDGLLILGVFNDSEGTQLARRTALGLQHPVYYSQLGGPVKPVRNWLRTLRSGIVNVAGPRESEQPGVYVEAFDFLERVISSYFATDKSTS